MNDRTLETEFVEGFVVELWARRSRVDASSSGVLILTDDDVSKRLDAARNGGLVVLSKDDLASSGWIARTLTDFSPGQRKSDVLARVGENDWTPVPVFLEKLESARRRGEDVLGFPATRAEAIVEFEARRTKRRRTTSEDADEPRGRLTGRVESGPEGVDRPEGYWKGVSDFLSMLPVDSAPISLL